MLKDDIKSYLTVGNYVSPNPVPVGTIRACDNHTLYSSQYYIMLQKNGQILPSDIKEWIYLIINTEAFPGLTSRFPLDTSIDAPDNFYGVLAAAKILNCPSIALDILNYGKKHLGFYNVANPNNILNKDKSINWSAFQWRQLPIWFACICSANKYKWYMPHHILLNFIVSIIICISNINETNDNTTNKLLTWCLIQSVKNDSYLCNKASKVWFKRMYKAYNVKINVMREIAGYYYYPKGLNNNPFSTYWID